MSVSGRLSICRKMVSFFVCMSLVLASFSFLMVTINDSFCQPSDTNSYSYWNNSINLICTHEMSYLCNTVSMRKATIAHEIGHALKLQHPVEALFNDTNNCFYPDEYKGWETFPSIMMPLADNDAYSDGTNYIKASQCIESYTITIYDTSCIRFKWEYEQI